MFHYGLNCLKPQINGRDLQSPWHKTLGRPTPSMFFYDVPLRKAAIRLLSLHPPTTEEAGKIAPSGITRVSQKENIAVPASAEAASQRGVRS